MLVLVSLLAVFSWSGHLREAEDRTALAPASGQFVRAHDVDVFVQEAGPADGPPVLLVHGTGAWSEIWRETMTFLAGKGCRAIAVDVPPFGFSEKPEGPDAYRRELQARRLLGVLDALDIRTVTVVAHSVGARPAIEAAILAPERHRNLVLVDPALGFAPRQAGEPARFVQNDAPMLMRAVFEALPIRNALLAGFGTNPLLTRQTFESFVSDPAAVTDHRVTMLRQPLSARGITRSYGDWFHYLMISHDSSRAADFAEFTKLPMPVLLIWGRVDDVTPLWQGEELQKLIPGSHLEVIDGTGHIPYLEDTDRFHAALWKFLEGKIRTGPWRRLSLSRR